MDVVIVGNLLRHAFSLCLSLSIYLSISVSVSVFCVEFLRANDHVNSFSLTMSASVLSRSTSQ